MTDKAVPTKLPDKRTRISRDYLGRANAATDDVDDDDGDPDGLMPALDIDQETAPDTFEEAVRDDRWVQSMKDEINALKNRGVWRVMKMPAGGVRLIKSK